ncbi:MAG: globin domain-containing protein [Chloroflexales bacterium]|nr:globin domain-containing protein [Chloroflexales bacterium]
MELQVHLLRTSFAHIKPHLGEFGVSFYQNLFAAYPQAKPLFTHTNMVQQQDKLLQALGMVIDNLQNTEVLSNKLRALGARHIEYGALPQHYSMVGQALLTTLEQYLGDDWTPELAAAWQQAYEVIAQFMLAGAEARAVKQHSHD